MTKFILTLIFGHLATSSFSQNYPLFGPEKIVTINGLTFDAMEPNISSDGVTLFFNNLNDGINTKLFYATRVNDTTFTFVGELPGANQLNNPQLDAVPDLDGFGHFYWTSTRDYPNQLDNLFHGIIVDGIVTNIGRVHGDFNKNIPGWLIMDHGISYDGQYLYFNNARFDGSNCTGVCETELGIAQKINDTLFTTLTDSDLILSEINNPNYIYYAPCISSDHKELYYTRYLKETITPATQFDICVAVRTTLSEPFSTPQVLFSAPLAELIEAPTLSFDKSKMYYHKKTTDSHIILMRERINSATTSSMNINQTNLILYPNPSSDLIQLKNITDSYNYNIYKLSGQKVNASGKIDQLNPSINIMNLEQGSYLIQFMNEDNSTKTLIFSKI
jgi:hypothetical protein